MLASRNLQISALGLSDLDQRVLQVAVGLLTDDGFSCKLLGKNNPNGQLLVIDIETEVGKEHFSKAHDTQVKLLFGAPNTSSTNTIALSKPVRVSSLKDLLAKVCQRLQAPSPETDLSSESINTGSVTHVKQRATSLFEVLHQAKLSKKLLKVQPHNAPALYINGFNGTVAILEKDKEALDSILSTPAGDFSVSALDINDMERCVSNALVSALDSCIWKVGVNSSSCEILAGHSMDKPIKLKAWPSFTRHDFRPVYFKIAAALAKQAISLNRLKETLQVPQQEVVNFYNAAYAVGLIETNPNSGGEVVQMRRHAAKPKSIISRLAERLGINFI